jgi:hypothetical protein
MGKDDTLSAGVALLGGGNLPYLRRRSALFNFPKPAPPLGAEEKDLVRTVDPLTYAENNRPRQMLMVEAARDIVVPPHCARNLWKALDHPPIRWIDTGHNGLVLGAHSAMSASASYLKNA